MTENDEIQAAPAEQEATPIAAAGESTTATHPGHAIIDEIQRVTKVQHAREWLHEKLEELRKLL